jgi:hypothetical protein
VDPTAGLDTMVNINLIVSLPEEREIEGVCQSICLSSAICGQQYKVVCFGNIRIIKAVWSPVCSNILLKYKLFYLNFYSSCSAD